MIADFLFIPVSPVITTAPPSVVTVTKAHDKVTLQCAARGSPVPSLEWSKDGMVVSTNTTTKTADEVKGELVIPSFSPSDQGVYKCFFRNYENGTAEIATTAGIQVTPHLACLRGCSMIKRRRNYKEVYFSLAPRGCVPLGQRSENADSGCFTFFITDVNHT